MMAACLFAGCLFADQEQETMMEQAVEAVYEAPFTVSVTDEQAGVIEELLTTMSKTNVVSLAFKKTYLRSIAKKLRPVSSTQFLGYVMERPDLVNHMKRCHKSSLKWSALTRSIVRGLKREAETTLFDDIPRFAEFTHASADELYLLAKNENFDGFIVHVLRNN